MKNKSIVSVVIIAVVLLIVFVVSGKDEPKTDTTTTEGSGPVTIGLVVPTLDNPYFVDLTEAAREEASKNKNIRLIVQAAERGATDVERQIEIVENLISQNVDALVLVPTDSLAIIPVILDANNSRIPVVIVDNNLDKEASVKAGVDIVSFIGSDNFIGGQIAGKFLGEYLGGTGEVAILEGISGTEAAIDRKEGFQDSISKFNNIKVVASQTANWDRVEGLNVFGSILQANPGIDGVFASNDEMALGAVRAIEERGMSGEVVVVGFDAIDDAIEAVNQGRMIATVAQQPKEMGRLGVLVAMKAITGEKSDEYVPVPLKLITKNNSN